MAEKGKTRGLRIAMIGTRGIPSSYSGFETFVEELSTRLVGRGHKVTVYCRSYHIKQKDKWYRGVELLRLPTIQRKHLDTIVHTFLSIVHLSLRKYDIVYICNVGNAVLSGIPRVFGKKVILNVDGTDWRRTKWGRFAKKLVKSSAYFAALFPNVVIADSMFIKNYYLQKFKKDLVFIPYGANIVQSEDANVLEDYGLEKRKYVLFVGRLVPENRAHDLIEAFERLQINTDMKLVIVGDAPYSDEYIRSLKSTRNRSIVFTGYVFGEGYKELSCNAYVFVVPTEAEGTHPVLLEAMASRNCVLVNNTPSNLEVIGDAGIPFDGAQGSEDLRKQLERLMQNPGLVETYREKAVKRVRDHYNWDRITDQYEKLFLELLSREGPKKG